MALLCARSVQNIRELDRTNVCNVFTRHRRETGDRDLRPCAPYGVVAGLRQLRSDDHIHRRRKRMLFNLLVFDLLSSFSMTANLRFSPVWLYICV
jgi:hypothetical protein